MSEKAFSAAGATGGPPHEELDHLRALLFEPEVLGVDELRRSFLELKHQFTNPEEFIGFISPLLDEALKRGTQVDKAALVEALAPLTAAAINEHYRKHPDEVAQDLAPVIGSSITEQIHSQRDQMVDALYPIIGTTIAKYMSEAVRELVQSINAKIERTVTVRGIATRMKAKALGVSEAELLLRESLPCKIHAVFLIHKSSGILVAQERNPAAKQFDSEMVSGMLTAIRSFVNEWIKRAGDVSEIDQIEYGRSKILLEVAGSCYLATVVEGEPEKGFYSAMRAVLARIVKENGKALEAYDGDPTSVRSSVTEDLQSLVAYETKRARQQNKPSLRPVVTAAIVVVLFLLAFFGFRWQQARANRESEARVQQALATLPSLRRQEVTVEADGENLRLSGHVENNYMRVKVQSLAQAAMPSFEIENTVTVQDPPPFAVLSLAEASAIASALNQVSGVCITPALRDRKLGIKGFVKDATLLQNVIQSFERLSGVDTITTAVVIGDPIKETTIHFERGSSELSEPERNKLLPIKEYLEIQGDQQLTLIGHSDLAGIRSTNEKLGIQRADAVKKVLAELGISVTRLSGARSDTPAPGFRADQPENRCVHFEVETRKR